MSQKGYRKGKEDRFERLFLIITFSTSLLVIFAMLYQTHGNSFLLQRLAIMTNMYKVYV